MLSWCLVDVKLLDHLIGILFWKSYSILSKFVKTNGTVGQYTFLDFANIRSYLTFNVSEWTRHLMQYLLSRKRRSLFWSYFGPFLVLSLSRKAKILQTTCITFRDPCISPQFFDYLFYVMENNRNLWCNLFAHRYKCVHSLKVVVFKTNECLWN